MTITRILRGPYRLFGLWWVDVLCGKDEQHISRRTEAQARQIAVGQDSVVIH